MERIPVQAFHQDLKAGAVPLENFNQCAPAIAEREHTAGIRIEMEFQFDDCRQAGITLPQIGNSAGQVDGCGSRKIKHNASKHAAEPSAAWPDSLRQLQSGSFPEKGW